MKDGEIRTISGDRGVHVLQRLESRDAKPAVYSAVKSDLRDLILEDKIRRALPEYIADLRRKADIKSAILKPNANQ